METTSLELHPTSIPEWDAEDEMTSVLARERLVKASDAESREMLERTRLDLPLAINWKELLQFAEHRQTPLALTIPPDSSRYSFYLIDLPLNIMVINQHLARLRLRLDLEAPGVNADQLAAYDLFPRDESDTKTILTGEISLDVSKSLEFLTMKAPLTGGFGFKLALPFKWTTTHPRVQTSDRMSNPVEWYVTDESIENGFTSHVIIRAPRTATVTVDATLVCDVRRAGLLGRILKAHFETISRRYTLKE